MKYRQRRHPRGMAWTPPEDETGYDGKATLTVGEEAVEVTVHLDGHLEPLDGSFHWYGRIERSASVSALKDAGATTGSLAIADRMPVNLRLAEYDPWGHVQVSGIGPPPYAMDLVEIDLPVAAVTS